MIIFFIVNLLRQIDKACKLFWSLNRLNTVCGNDNKVNGMGKKGTGEGGGECQCTMGVGGSMWWMSTCKMNEICTLQCGMLVAAPSGFVLSLQDACPRKPSRWTGGNSLIVSMAAQPQQCAVPWHCHRANQGTSAESLGLHVGKSDTSQHLLEYPQKHCNTPHARTHTHALDKTTRGRNRHLSSIVKTNYSVNKSQYTGLYMHPEAISCRVYKSNVSTCTIKHSLRPGCSVAGNTAECTEWPDSKAHAIIQSFWGEKKSNFINDDKHFRQSVSLAKMCTLLPRMNLNNPMLLFHDVHLHQHYSPRYTISTDFT